MELTTSKTEQALQTASSEVSLYVKTRETEVAELVEKYGGLIADASNDEGYEQCKEVRRELLPVKIELEEDRKKLKAPITAAGKLVDGAMKPLVAKVESLYKPFEEAYRAKDKAEEDAKLAREAKVQTILSQINHLTMSAFGETSDSIEVFIIDVKELVINEELFGIQYKEAIARKNAAIEKLETLLEQTKKQEAFEAKQKDIEEREARIAAAEKAEEDRIAEQKRQEEQAKREEQLRKEAKERAEADRKAAEARHKQELAAAERRAEEQAEQAAAAERRRIAQEDADKQAEQYRRERSRKHRAAINSQIVIALQQGAGIDEDQAREVVKLAVEGRAGALTVNY